MRPLLRGRAAVEREDAAGGEPALVAGKKQDAGGELCERAETAEQRRKRLALADGSAPLLRISSKYGVSVVPGAMASQRIPSPK